MQDGVGKVGAEELEIAIEGRLLAGFGGFLAPEIGHLLHAQTPLRMVAQEAGELVGLFGRGFAGEFEADQEPESFVLWGLGLHGII